MSRRLPDDGVTATTATLQEQARALGDPTRHAIFNAVAEAEGPIGVAELNQRFPLNHNAIRQHLAKLVRADLVVERTTADGRRGRPRLVYEIAPAAAGRWGDVGPYERLSRMLVEVISTGLDPTEVGRRAAAATAPPRSGDTVADLAAAMARQGFEPEVRPTGAGAEIVLRHCPFATAALADRRTVCALHLGIAEGLANGGPVVVDELVANDPRHADCLLRLRHGDGSAGAHQANAVLTLRRS
jgi:predicted ArsR family transcriptional regulator